MRKLSDLTGTERETVASMHAFADSLVAKTLLANATSMLMAHIVTSAQPNKSELLCKFNHFLFASAIHDFVGIALELNDPSDQEYQRILLRIKLDCILASYNIEILSAVPFFSKFHGQDFLFFLSIEDESLFGEVNFFNISEYRDEFKKIYPIIFSAVDSADSTLNAALSKLYQYYLSDVNRLNQLDFSFKAIRAEARSDLSRKFLHEFESFMSRLPAHVYHCHEGITNFYSNKGFIFNCPCGRQHLVDRCDAICDGGSEHYAVLLAECGKAIVKIKSIGWLSVKGIEVDGAMFSSSSGLINVSKEAIASRKRITT